jgi:hypothetical protein
MEILHVKKCLSLFMANRVAAQNISSRDVSEKVFENSGHSPMFNESAAFWNDVINWVKVH